MRTRRAQVRWSTPSSKDPIGAGDLTRPLVRPGGFEPPTCGICPACSPLAGGVNRHRSDRVCCQPVAAPGSRRQRRRRSVWRSAWRRARGLGSCSPQLRDSSWRDQLLPALPAEPSSVRLRCSCPKGRRRRRDSVRDVWGRRVWPSWLGALVSGVVGVLLLLHGYAVRAQCDTFVGQLAQSVSRTAARDCVLATAGFYGGIALVVLAVALAARARRREIEPPKAPRGWYPIGNGYWSYFDGWEWGAAVRDRRPGGR